MYGEVSLATRGSRARRPFGRALIPAGLLCVALAGGAYGSTTPQPRAGEPLPDLTQGELDRFLLGKVAFDRDFTPGEGLGPIFNQNSCGACHITPLGGTGTIKVLRCGQVDKGGFDPLEDLGGSLFQLEAIDDMCREDPPAFANVCTDRVTNGMMGYGLVEAILDCDILAVRDAQGAAVQGKAHFVDPFEPNPVGEPCSPETQRVGRFGWKAQVPTILTFSADAALNEIGLTNQFLMQDNDPNGIDPPSLGAPDFCDTVADPEDNLSLGNGVDREFIEVVTDFQRFMVGPPQTPKSGMSGETTFNSIGCADCHHAQYTTPDDPGLEAALRNKTIQPYSDFLLHDMGPKFPAPAGGGDGIVQGAGNAQELKTPPLWGLRLRNELWHDGRFADPTRVEDAILAHDEGFGISQAAASAAAFDALSQPEKDALLAFLDSLGLREFDFDRNDVITIDDFHGFGDPGSYAACFGPGPYTADDPCAIHDIDQDGDVDHDDTKVFLVVYSGPRSDCNGNDILDLIDILDGTSLDANNNGIPDTCEPTCAGDMDGSGGVEVGDLLILLGDWGECAALPDPCPADLNNDGLVNVIDLLDLLAFWGPC